MSFSNFAHRVRARNIRKILRPIVVDEYWHGLTKGELFARESD